MVNRTETVTVTCPACNIVITVTRQLCYYCGRPVTEASGQHVICAGCLDRTLPRPAIRPTDTMGGPSEAK